MKLYLGIAMFVLAAALSAAGAEDSRISELCGRNHVNEIANAGDVRPNPDGYYVVSLHEQLSHGDPRIIRATTGGEFHLCTRPAATPDMEATRAILLMRERTVKYLFVPIAPRRPKGPS